MIDKIMDSFSENKKSETLGPKYCKMRGRSERKVKGILKNVPSLLINEKLRRLFLGVTHSDLQGWFRIKEERSKSTQGLDFGFFYLMFFYFMCGVIIRVILQSLCMGYVSSDNYLI